LAGKGDLLAAQQAPDYLDGFLNGDSRCRRAKPHLIDPDLHPGADSENGPPRRKFRERCKFHPDQGRMAGERIYYAKPNPNAAGGTGQRRSDGESAAKEVVLRHPTRGKAQFLGQARILDLSTRIRIFKADAELQRAAHLPRVAKVSPNGRRGSFSAAVGEQWK